MRFSLIPRELRFHDMLDEIVLIVSRAGGKFLEMLNRFDNLADRAKGLKDEELKCDAVVEKIIRSLNVSFITPFDREDIHTLASSLDDILDNMEETAHRLAVFQMASPTPAMIKLATQAVECCGHLEKAVHLIRNLKDDEEISRHLIEVGRLENEADIVYRDADAALFVNGNAATDILMLIKLREVYSWLEATVDACKRTANVISEIVIKGS